jgi:hypothetical protein
MIAACLWAGSWRRLGIDGDGVRHPLGVLEGATENAAVVQALLDNLSERGLDPKVCRLFIIDGSKALRKAICRTVGKHTHRYNVSGRSAAPGSLVQWRVAVPLRQHRADPATPGHW